jgi:hypothetical protein
MKYGLASLCIALLTGCGGAKASPDMTPAPHDMAPIVGMLCSDARADNWTLPIAKASKNGAFNVTLVDSTASPPIIGDLTKWTLQIADATGAMLDGATIAVKPWMPDHGHGTSVNATVMPVGAPGQYAITPLYLFMAGYWTVTFTITTGTTSDTVVYSVCLSDGT